MATNREAAEELQTALIRHGTNLTVPIRSDRDVTDAELRTHHILLIGRPECNRISREFASAFPVTFGKTSFRVGSEVYGHPGSGVVAAAVNPRAPLFSVVLVAGLSAASTFALAPRLGYGEGSGEIAIFENGGAIHSRVLPAPEMVKELDAK